MYDGLPASIVELPSLRGLARANGREPIRIITKGAIYDCGGLAPVLGTGPTLTAGARATSTLECGVADIPNNDAIVITTHAGTLVTIRFCSAANMLGYGSNEARVLVSGTIDGTLENLRKMIQGEGGAGVIYNDGPLIFTGINTADTLDVECPQAVNTTDHSLLFRVRSFGTHGNSYEPSIDLDTANGLTTGLGAGFFDSGGGGSFTGGTNASGTQPTAATRRYFFTNYRDADSAETGPSPATQVTTALDGNISLSALTANADTTFDYTRIYRTEPMGVEFFHLKTIARGGTTATDDVSDASLILGGNVPLAIENFRTYSEGFPPKGRCLALWKGRLWTGGAVLSATYTRGTAAVTASSGDVTISSGNPTQYWVGRTFQVDSTSEKYLILKVDGATKILTLNRAYAGSTNGTAGYSVRDERDPTQVYCSVPFLFNQWPFDNNPGGIETDDAEGITGFMPTKHVLYVSSPTSIAAITGEDIESWQMETVVRGIGWAAERLCVAVGDAMVFLSRAGICAWSGVGEPQVISSPPTRRGRAAVGIEATIRRISWANVRQGFATYIKESRQVRFAVPLDGAEVPNYEIVLDLQNQTWSLFRRPAWTASANIVLPGGGQAVLYGGREGELLHADTGNSDGCFAIEPVIALSGAQTKRVLTTGGTTLTGNYVGSPVVVIYADGSTVALGKVASHSTSAVTLAEDLATAPAAADQIVIGGIWWRAKTGFYSRGENFERTQWRDTTISHVPVASGDYHYAFAIENGTFAIPTQGYTIGDPTASNGRRRFRNQKRAMNKADLIQGFKPGPAPTIRGVTPSIGQREKDSA